MTDKLFSKTHGISASAGSLVVSPPVRTGHAIRPGDEVWIDEHEGTVFPRSAFGKGSCRYEQVGSGNSYYDVSDVQGAIELKNGNIVSFFYCRYGSSGSASLYIVIQDPSGNVIYKQPNDAIGLATYAYQVFFIAALDDDKTLLVNSTKSLIKVELEDDYSGVKSSTVIASGSANTSFVFILENTSSFYFSRVDSGALIEVSKSTGELTAKGSGIAGHYRLMHSSLVNTQTSDGLFFYQDYSTKMIHMLDPETGSYIESLSAPNNVNAQGICKLADNVAVFVFTNVANIIYFVVTWANGNLTGQSFTSDIAGGFFSSAIKVHYSAVDNKICVTGRLGNTNNHDILLASAKYSPDTGIIDQFTYQNVDLGFSASEIRADTLVNSHSLRVSKVGKFGSSSANTSVALASCSQMDFSPNHVSKLGIALSETEVLVTEPIQSIPEQGTPSRGYVALSDSLMMKVEGVFYNANYSSSAKPGVISGTLTGNSYPLFTHKKSGGIRQVDVACFNDHATGSYSTTICAGFDGFYINSGVSNAPGEGVIATFGYLSNTLVASHVNNRTVEQIYNINMGAYNA